MYRKIRSKMVILGNRKPYKKEVQQLLQHTEKKNWIYFNMRLEGSRITIEDLENILTSDRLVDLPVEELVLLRNLEKLYENIGLWAKEGRPLSRKIMGAIYETVTGQEPAIRKHQPTVMEWSFVPVMANQIEEEIDKLIAFSKEEAFDLVARALDIHNMFLEIFPFSQANQLVARGIMSYYLVMNGLPMPLADIREEEYNGILCEELNKGWEKSSLYEYIGKGILEMLNLADSLTAQYG